VRRETATPPVLGKETAEGKKNCLPTCLSSTPSTFETEQEFRNSLDAFRLSLNLERVSAKGEQRRANGE
jgi:hypothetical protein